MAGNLDRFLQAQNVGGTYRQALAELTAGAKRTHWMWFIFPQLAGLGQSATARRYAIADAAEARDYLAHPVLGPRLRECTAAMLGWAGRRSAQVILGPVDATKFASAMTLFEHVASPSDADFGDALDRFCAGQRDTLTLALLARTA